MPQTDVERRQLIRDYENPTCGYRRGEDGEIEKAIFDGKAPAGWADSPARVDVPPEPEPEPEPKLVTEVGEISPAEPVAIAEGTLEPPYDDYKINELRAEFKRRTGRGPGLETGRLSLITSLTEMDLGE